MVLSVGARRIVAFLAGLATFYFAGWMGSALLSIFLPGFLAAVVGFGAAVWLALRAGRYVAASLASESPALAVCVIAGALLVGGVGFIGGFFGPMIFAPGANQGPLLGLFYTWADRLRGRCCCRVPFLVDEATVAESRMSNPADQGGGEGP